MFAWLILVISVLDQGEAVLCTYSSVLKIQNPRDLHFCYERKQSYVPCVLHNNYCRTGTVVIIRCEV